MSKVQLKKPMAPMEIDAPYKRYWEEMPCYLSVHDREFRIIDGNRKFRSDFGESVGEYCYKVYKGRDEVCPDCPVEATFNDGRGHGSEQLLTTSEGVDTPVGADDTVTLHLSGIRGYPGG